MSDSKRFSRREMFAASGAVLVPLAAASANAQAQPPQQAPQGAPPAGGPPRPPADLNEMPMAADPNQPKSYFKSQGGRWGAGEPFYPPEGNNKPMGTGRGIFPGRVVWVHNPEVCKWDGKTGEWWDDANTDGPLAESMLSTSLQGTTGKKTDKEAWDALFRHFNQTRNFGNAGYKPGEKITIKINCNYDRSNSAAWPSKKGMVSPHLVNALAVQLVKNAGIPGKDILFYDVAQGRYMGDPIVNRIRANADPQYKDIVFMCNVNVAANGRVPGVADKTDPIKFSHPGVGAGQAFVPTAVVEAKYRINFATMRPHEIAGTTLTTKNNFGSIYWPEQDYWGPRPLHTWFARQRPAGSYNVLVDIMGNKHFNGKNMLYMMDGLYTAEHSELNVIRMTSFGDTWTASVFMSLDPVAIDSVGLDFLRSEPKISMCRGNIDNFLHEAALAEKPPSGTVYAPSGTRLSSLGVHEHWNNPVEKKYSRNLGKKEGIELLALKAPAPKA